MSNKLRLVALCSGLALGLSLLAVFGFQQSAKATPPAAAVQAVTAIAALNSVTGVVVLSDPNFWRIELASSGCAGGVAPLAFYNMSTQAEYVTWPDAPVQRVAVGGTADLAASGASATETGLVQVTAADGQASAYLIRSNVNYQCRVTAQLAVSPLLTPSKLAFVSVTGRLSVNTDTPEVVLFAQNWQIELGEAAAGTCWLGSGDAPFIFRNTSSAAETIQGGPFSTPTSVAPGTTANLGVVETWPSGSNPLGALSVTSQNDTTTAYLTGAFSAGAGCWGTANTNLVQN